MKFCSKCRNFKELEDFSKDSSRKDGLMPICRDCNGKGVRSWRSRNPEKAKVSVELSMMTFKKANPGRIYANLLNWRKINPGKVLAQINKRRCAKLNRTPAWLTETHFQQIEIFYDAAKRLSEEFGEPMSVDHIIPLQGKIVSGLHVPWNLQVIPAKLNSSKNNRF